MQRSFDRSKCTQCTNSVYKMSAFVAGPNSIWMLLCILSHRHTEIINFVSGNAEHHKRKKCCFFLDGALQRCVLQQATPSPDTIPILSKRCRVFDPKVPTKKELRDEHVSVLGFVFVLLFNLFIGGAFGNKTNLLFFMCAFSTHCDRAQKPARMHYRIIPNGTFLSLIAHRISFVNFHNKNEFDSNKGKCTRRPSSTGSLRTKLFGNLSPRKTKGIYSTDKNHLSEM